MASCTFRTAQGNATFGVYQGQEYLQENVGEPGDVCAVDSDVFMKTLRGWEPYAIGGELSQRIRHPYHPQRVLSRENGQFSWMTLSTFRVRKSRLATKGQTVSDKLQGVEPGVDQSATSSDVLSSQGTGDGWLKELYSRWSTPPLSTYPRFMQGSNIFKGLMGMPNPIPIFPSFPSTDVFAGPIKPTLQHIIMDLFLRTSETLDVYDVSADQTAAGMTKAAFISSMISSSPARWTPTSNMLALHSLPYHPNGTFLCQPQLPKIFQNNTIVQSNCDGPAWDSTICPPGSLTEIHNDYHGSAIMMVDIHCDKLWLLWPATESNLKWWSQHHNRASNGAQITCDALAHLEGLQVIHCTGSKAFILPPYHLHAVFTFEASAHSGIALWGFPWWESSRQGIEWEIEWASNHSIHGCSATHALEVLNAINNESLGYWKLVIDSFPQHERVPVIRDWLTSTQINIQIVLRTIQSYVDSGSPETLIKRKGKEAPQKSKKRRI